MGEKVTMKTGLERRCVVLKETTFQGQAGQLRLLTGLTWGLEPTFFLACSEPEGLWQDLFADSPGNLPLLVEHIHRRVTAKPRDKEWGGLCRAMAGLVRQSRAGLTTTVRAIQTKASRSMRWRAA
ncbi:hypothetical protein NNJEOMEG_02575 [Fundidesulfovibrio magnetotacticus]|uniref:Uncharacterized protein n=1 Tax=Fundidesulfovibrio magnetotacticus TaxID=2730080 RepID=A0A6V8LWT3_9BACT|nr:hypothetical protein NNJEOMEG_02575 [Fundidesulfovibrio magnetotacticus]